MALSKIPRSQLIRRSLWTSSMLKKKLSFKLLRNDVTFVDDTRAETRGTIVQAVRCESNTTTGKPYFRLKPEN